MITGELYATVGTNPAVIAAKRRNSAAEAEVGVYIVTSLGAARSERILHSPDAIPQV